MGQYLVTGAAGFIGAAVAKRILDAGHKVLTIDNLSTGDVQNIPKGVEFVHADCQDQSIYKKIAKNKYDAILHIAGQSSGEISFANPVYDLQTNAQSTLLLLKLALETGCKKIIYASSMCVYGDYLDKSVLETDICDPKSFYAVGKIASEQYLKLYQQYGIKTISLRFSNVYGPGQNMKNLRQGMISIFLAQAMENKHIVVKGSKERYRDHLYIGDTVDAFMLAIDDKKADNDIFNIGTGNKTTVNDLLIMIQDLLPFQVTVEYTDGTPGDQFGIYGNVSKAKSKFDFRAKISLRNGLEKMIAWSLS